MSLLTPPTEVHLPGGQFHFGGGPVRVRTLLGTCVAIMVWHPQKRIGGMCHYLLPTRQAASRASGMGPGLFADEVMGLFADALRAAQTQPGDYVAKIAGGGSMFPAQLAHAECRDGDCGSARRAVCPSVGCKNVVAGRELLLANGFRIAAEDVGGRGSRQVVFDLSSGNVWIKRGSAMSVPEAAA